MTLTAIRKFLKQTNRAETTTIISELVQFKRDNPKDTSIERELKLWRAENNSDTTDTHICRILGIFRHNFAPLEMHIHVSGNSKTIPISEPTLRSIRQDASLTTQEQDAIDLMTYGAERRQALSLLPLENVHLIEDSNVAVLDIPARLSKTATAHPSIIPKELAERLLERAIKEHQTELLPNYRTMWRRVTKLARDTYKVRLTSHYFRKRFETIAERIPSNEMNPNHWVILMGSKPTLGHMPEIYSLMSDHELIQEYETYLMPRLALTGETVKTQETTNETIQRLLKIIEQLTQQLTEARTN